MMNKIIVCVLLLFSFNCSIATHGITTTELDGHVSCTKSTMTAGVDLVLFATFATWIVLQDSTTKIFKQELDAFLAGLGFLGSGTSLAWGIQNTAQICKR